MTFEEFKRNFEIFAKIDTPEKLDICRRQYQTYLLSQEDANFFEPSKEIADKTDLLSIYKKNLYSILKFNQISKDQVLFLVQPSFEPENLLIIDKLSNNYSLTHISIPKNYWAAYYDNNSITNVDTILSKSYLNREIGERIFLLVENSMHEAREPKAKTAVLDGTVYKFSKLINEQRIDIFKHSPDEESKTGKIIRLFELIIESTKLNSTSDYEEKIQSILDSIQNGQ